MVVLARQGPTVLGPLDLRLVWARCARRAMLSCCCSCLTFSTQWDGDFSSTYSYDSDGYRYANRTEIYGRNGDETGDVKWLTPPHR